jgi:hypothetical protein
LIYNRAIRVRTHLFFTIQVQHSEAFFQKQQEKAAKRPIPDSATASSKKPKSTPPTTTTVGNAASSAAATAPSNSATSSSTSTSSTGTPDVIELDKDGNPKDGESNFLDNVDEEEEDTEDDDDEPSPPLLSLAELAEKKEAAYKALINTLHLNGYKAWSKLVISDAGFGGVSMVVQFAQMKISCIAGIKVAIALFPKKALEALMKDMPSGKWATMTATVDGENIIAVAYKYNAKKILYFCLNEGAGPLLPGQPYTSKFADAHGNRCTRPVERPVAISRYFQDSNVIDSHNHSRQSALGLEDAHLTSDAYLRLSTTLWGMHLVDTMKACQHIREFEHNRPESVQSFTDSLASLMISNDLPGRSTSSNTIVMATKPTTVPKVQLWHTLIRFGWVETTNATTGKKNGYYKNNFCKGSTESGSCNKRTSTICGHPECNKTFYCDLCFVVHVNSMRK